MKKNKLKRWRKIEEREGEWKEKKFFFSDIICGQSSPNTTIKRDLPLPYSGSANKANESDAYSFLLPFPILFIKYKKNKNKNKNAREKQKRKKKSSSRGERNEIAKHL